MEVHEQQPTPPPPPKQMVCGGYTDAREISDQDKALFEKYRSIVEEKVQGQFQVPKDFKIEPTKIRTQVVNGTNYSFHVRLHNGQFAHVRIYEPIKRDELTAEDRAKNVFVDKETTAD